MGTNDGQESRIILLSSLLYHLIPTAAQQGRWFKQGFPLSGWVSISCHMSGTNVQRGQVLGPVGTLHVNARIGAGRRFPNALAH